MNPETTSSFRDWRRRLRQLERACPWPGPRPLGRGDQLVGREEDRQRFRQQIDSNRLILLTGESGVGKSSLLEAGLVPELEEAGYTVAVCRDWSGDASNEAAEFVASKVRHVLIDRLPVVADAKNLFETLERDFGGLVVLVLDQFEELIRDRPELAEDVCGILLDLNYNTRIKVVISFRSEYLLALRNLEKGAKPFTISRYVLEEVEDRFAEEIITAANDSVTAIEPDAVELLVTHWTSARTARPTGSVRAAGLLQLQALLYALYAEAGGAPVTSDTIKTLVETSTGPGFLFSEGLRRSIEIKLEHCRGAAGPGDPYLLEGTTSLLVTLVSHLASDGFKLIRDATDLARIALARQAESLGSELTENRETLSGIVSALVNATSPTTVGNDLDLLHAARLQIAKAADDCLVRSSRRPFWQETLAADATSGEADPESNACGPMFGMPHAAVFVEELRRFAFALAWLRHTGLVRITMPDTQHAIVSLVHDGFGDALELWARSRPRDPAAALHALTAVGGASHIWNDPIEGPNDPQPRLLVNLRWKGAVVRAAFRNVAFVNCDLRGTMFRDCLFECVTFVNCTLDGVILTECTVVGRPSPVPSGEEWDTTPPVYAFPDPGDDLLANIARYRGDRFRPDREAAPSDRMLLAPWSSYPAIPVATDDTTARNPDGSSIRIRVCDLATAGVHIRGGRISSFLVRNCNLRDGGISFREVGGSGLDCVEQDHGYFEFYGCAIRNLTFTPNSGPVPDAAELIVVATGSALIGLWIGERLRGSLTAQKCLLTHMWNGSESVKTRAVGCEYHGIVNPEHREKVLQRCTPTGSVESFYALREVDSRGEIAGRARVMDYVRPGAQT